MVGRRAQGHTQKHTAPSTDHEARHSTSLLLWRARKTGKNHIPTCQLFDGRSPAHDGSQISQKKHALLGDPATNASDLRRVTTATGHVSLPRARSEGQTHVEEHGKRKTREKSAFSGCRKRAQNAHGEGKFDGNTAADANDPRRV